MNFELELQKKDKEIEILKSKLRSFSGEDIYVGEKEVKYVFKKRNSDYLIVGFSGIPKIGTPPNYNYAKTLVNTEINQLFILDHHGMIGCYYLGENKEFAVERSVYELIEKIRVENNICKENVITFGSSKGGVCCSLFFL